MLKELRVIGESSERVTSLDVSNDDLTKTLMDYLREKNIPIASSCRGEGVCKKCLISKKVLSCSLTVKEYLDQHGCDISVSYL